MYSEGNDFSRFVFCRAILAEVDFNPAIIAVTIFRCDDRLYFAFDSDDRPVRFFLDADKATRAFRVPDNCS
jgi:hypothetical protein